MIEVTKNTDLSFSIIFDEAMTETLSDIQWTSVEAFLRTLISDALLGWNPPEEYLHDLDDEVPF